MTAKQTVASRREPWEGLNGMFDIDGWARAVRIVPKVFDEPRRAAPTVYKLPKSALIRRRRA